MSSTTFAPLVSVVMANHNGAAHIAAAVRSVLRQTLAALELILSDDCSSDESVALARGAAGGDPRLIVLESNAKGGPAAARNRALQAARGKWIAIVDSDDFIHPERLERLVAAAEADKADIVADDMVTFYDNQALPPHAHLKGALARRPSWIAASAYVRTNHLFGRGASLGYLKPVLRRIGRDGEPARYDESLNIAEDFDLVMRLLLSGARMRTYPELGYFYRKHAGSISHRLKAADIDAMIKAHDRLSQGHDIPAELGEALHARRASLLTARAFGDFVGAVKARDFGAALTIALKRPSALLLLRYPIRDRLFRKTPRPAPANGPPRIALLSRQRVIGATNGSSTYLLSIVGALSRAGFAVDYIGASPKIFGRWPMLRLKSEISIFARYGVRGGVRVGNVIFTRDARVWFAAALAVFERVLTKLRLPSLSLSKPADYAIAAKAERADMLYVARQVGANTQAIVCDYAFLAPLAPYALVPEAPVLTIMHDLMSARATEDPNEKVPDEVAALTPAQEFRLLGLADVVVAIQAGEAAKVRAALPEIETIVAPHFVEAVDAPQIGENDTLLFVGSNTAPNVVGLRWFFEAVWPLVRAARPAATISVAGGVARSLDSVPEGVRMLGVVPDLKLYYRDAGLVISPLRTGSGLKIKLIEALAAGKAIIGTTVTAQGVENIVAGAMIITDDPVHFARAILDHLNDSEKRRALASAALLCAQANFSPDACFGPLIARLNTVNKTH
jgi:glycosyltransferase involved in cell wall biosynthesis